MYTFDETIVSDLYKDAYGFRPGQYFWTEWNEATAFDKQAIWDRLLKRHEMAMDEEAQREIAAINAFELEIAAALDLGAPSREDAVRWIVDALVLNEYDLMYGGSYICFLKGLPYRMSKMFDSVIKQIEIKEVA